MKGNKNEKKFKINTDKINQEIERRLREEMKKPIQKDEKKSFVEISNQNLKYLHQNSSSNLIESIKIRDNEDINTTIKEYIDCKSNDIVCSKFSREIINSLKYCKNKEQQINANNSQKYCREINNFQVKPTFREDRENVSDEEADENLGDKWKKLLSHRNINLPSKQLSKLENYNHSININNSSYEQDSYICKFKNHNFNLYNKGKNFRKLNQSKKDTDLSENNLLNSIKKNCNKKSELKINVISNKGSLTVKQNKLDVQIAPFLNSKMNSRLHSYFKSKSVSGLNKIYDQTKVYDRLYEKGMQTMKNKDEASNLNIHSKIIGEINNIDFKPNLNNITKNKSINLSKRMSFKTIFDFEDYKWKRKNINLSVSKFHMIREKGTLNTFSPQINHKHKASPNQEIQKEEIEPIITKSKIDKNKNKYLLIKLLERFNNSLTPKLTETFKNDLRKYTNKKKNNFNVSEESHIPFTRIKSISPIKTNPFSCKLEAFEHKEYKETNYDKNKTLLSNSFKVKMQIKTDKILEKMKYKSFNVLYEILMSNSYQGKPSDIELCLKNYHLPQGIIKALVPIILNKGVYDDKINKISISQFFKELSSIYSNLSIPEKNALLRIGKGHSKRRNTNEKIQVK